MDSDTILFYSNYHKYVGIADEPPICRNSG